MNVAKLNTWIVLPMVVASGIASPLPSDAASRTEKTVEKAAKVFEEIMVDSNSRIPRRLLEESQGIVIIPDVLRAGFFFGGTRGTGVMVVREPDGPWSNPAFVSLTAGSVGLQFGAKSTDIVMVFKSREAIQKFLTGSFRLGGSVSGTAGPIESSPVNSARGFNNAPVYTYARSSGLFGGLSLEGTELGFDNKRNSKFYGKQLSARQIFNDPFITAPPVVESLRDVLEQAEAGVLRPF
ncbi:MAG: lipid-binding SYLF domain-containing protein [Thermosynechococcaceae cyanobacterium MS004]|nr:lipid-binding SYLF domain-containing protein [Thermosynechococcaceae cyanobacterium MS004]